MINYVHDLLCTASVIRKYTFNCRTVWLFISHLSLHVHFRWPNTVWNKHVYLVSLRKRNLIVPNMFRSDLIETSFWTSFCIFLFILFLPMLPLLSKKLSTFAKEFGTVSPFPLIKVTHPSAPFYGCRVVGI